MPFSALYGQYNAEGSFNRYFSTQLTAAGLPAFMPSAVVNYEYPDAPLTFPSLSVTHLGTVPREVAEGRHLDDGWKGVEQNGIAQIDCWESRQRASGAHKRNVSIMRDMVARVFATGAAMPLMNLYGSTANPSGLTAIIRSDPAIVSNIMEDTNPDIVRVSCSITYRWLERISGV